MITYFKLFTKISFLSLLLFVNGIPQQKTGYNSIREAIFASRQLRGKSGPVNLNWIDKGNKYSYTAKNDSGVEEIRSFDPATLKDQLIFDGKGLTFPGTDKQFEYNSFQWAKDSKHLLFQTGFKKILICT